MWLLKLFPNPRFVMTLIDLSLLAVDSFEAIRL